MNFLKGIKYSISLVGYIDITLIPYFLKIVFIRFKYFYVPTIALYISSIPLGVNGSTWLGLILIKPQYFKDKTILSHEVIHIKQLIKSKGKHYVRYNMDELYRYDSELKAYSYQCLHSLKLIQCENKTKVSKKTLDYLMLKAIKCSIRKFVNELSSRNNGKTKAMMEKDFKIELLALILHSELNGSFRL